MRNVISNACLQLGKQGWAGRMLGSSLVMGPLCVLLIVAAPAANAFNFDVDGGALGDFKFTWNNRLSAGAQVRTEKRSNKLIDKSNISGQRTLCAGLPSGSSGGISGFFNPDCQSRIGDPTPSQVLINARGGYNINGDDGDLNYDQGDMTYTTLFARSEFSGYWKNFTLKLSGIGYYDPTNNDFQNNKSDLQYPNRGLSRDTITIERERYRHRDVEDDLGEAAKLLEAWVGAEFTVADIPFNVRVGRQRLRWGESNLFNFNVLDRINPLSERLFSIPGVEVRDAFLPVGMVTVGADVTSSFSFQAFYQFEWQRTEPASCGSYFSVNDVAACGRGPTPVYLSQGQYPEDPFGQFVPGGGDVLLDQGIRTTYLDDRSRGYPDDGGQFGLRLTYYANWLNNGTELSLYGMNIHSRLPYLSVDAADETCLQTTGTGSAVVTDLSAVCGNRATPFADTFPVSTVNPFLDYPEDIHIFGTSFTTNVGNWSLSGELSYTPNQPAQVSYADVLFAGLQPAFPDTPAGLKEGSLLDGQNALLIPTDRIAVPDYLETGYRGHDVQAGDTIRGYERLKVSQFDMTGIRVFGGSNPIGADQIILVAEVAAIKVFDMPSLNHLQFEGATARTLHYSEGAGDFNDTPFTQGGDDGVAPGDPGASQCPNPGSGCRPIGPTDHINPERADPDNFAGDFATGYRLRINATYNNVIGDIGFTPLLEFFHDVYGTSISPGQDFVEGRKRLTLGSDVSFTDKFSGNISYRFFWGAGYRNLRLDRDYLEASLSYAF